MRNRLVALLAIMILFVFISSVSVFSQEATEHLSLNIIAGYLPPNQDGFASSGFIPIDFSVDAADTSSERNLGSSGGGGVVLASMTYALSLPVLAGDGPLFSGNNIETKAVLELSPVTLEAKASATLTPIAFFSVQAGVSAGTGWSVGFIGLAINPWDNADPLEETPFGGAVLGAWGSGTLQFDLAALLPGEWNHVVVQATGEFEYRVNTAAQAGEAWYWQADRGMNFNGWRYLGTYVLGYMLPKKVNFIGVMLETQAYLGSVRDYGPMATGWGSDFVTLTISPMANIAFDDRNGLTVLAQIKSSQDWTDGTTKYRSFQQRIYAGRIFYLYDIAVSYTYTFK